MLLVLAVGIHGRVLQRRLHFLRVQPIRPSPGAGFVGFVFRGMCVSLSCAATDRGGREMGIAFCIPHQSGSATNMPNPKWQP